MNIFCKHVHVLKNYTCYLCDKVYNRPNTLKHHIDTVHEGLKNESELYDTEVQESQNLI